MVSQKINFTNLDGEDCTKTYWFNLSSQDFVRLELRYTPKTEPSKEDSENEDGTKKTNLQMRYEELMAEKDLEGAFDLLSDLIETSYGVREGDSFVKNRRVNGRDSRPDLANFRYHPAFEQLLIDIMKDSKLLLVFFRNLTNVRMTDEEFSQAVAKLELEKETGDTTTDTIHDTKSSEGNAEEPSK